jgi:hypothetical protein
MGEQLSGGMACEEIKLDKNLNELIKIVADKFFLGVKIGDGSPLFILRKP